MKTKQELLDFYGVEIGKKYKIVSATSELFQKLVGRIFQITETYDYLKITSTFGEYFSYDIDRLIYLYYEEVKPSILDDEERQYLQRYVMDNPAFKGKVKSIAKCQTLGSKKDFLRILIDCEFIYLPNFKIGSKYKGMEYFKQYTPKELGLEEQYEKIY